MTDTPESLYAAWFKTVPEVFRAMLPPGSGGAGSPTADRSEPASSLPFPADPIGRMLGTVGTMLTQLYQAYLPLLAEGGPSADALKGLADTGTQTLQRMREWAALPQSAWPELQPWMATARSAPPWGPWLDGLLPGASAGLPGAHPLQVGIERTFGGLGEAFGLGPVRELEQALREMALAGVAKQRAQLEYLELVAEAWHEGTRRLLQDLTAMGARGEPVESLLVLIRLWAKAVDAPMHATMQSERGLAVTAKAVRAATEHRQRLQKAVALASEALHVPTRADVDEAYREIQELKRELRRLKKALPPSVLKKLTPARESEA